MSSTRRIDAIRQSARDRTCTFALPGCKINVGVVWCHAPLGDRGVALKAPDWWGAYGCWHCHQMLDQHKLDRIDELEAWMLGIRRSWQHLVAAGIIRL